LPDSFLFVNPIGYTFPKSRSNKGVIWECIEIVTEYGEHNFKLTMSFGVVTYPIHGQEAAKIIIQADKALCQSKRPERNCVITWTEPIR
jgi:GGDEF domain-containing protein